MSSDDVTPDPHSAPIDVLAAAIDSLDSGADFRDLAGTVRNVELSDALAQPLQAAFDYMPPRHDREAFTPMLGFEDGTTYPPPLSEVPPDWLEAWSLLAERARHPGAVAHLRDLLQAARAEDRYRNATAAVDDYRRAAAAGGVGSLTRSDRLLRALDIARSYNLDDRARGVAAQIAETAGEELADPGASGRPGVVLPLLEALIRVGYAGDETDALLAAARGVYSKAYLAEDLIDMQLRRGGDAGRLARERVESWLAEADRTEGLVRLDHLERAARLAADLGVDDLRESAELAIQRMGPDDLDFAMVSSDVEIPEDVQRDLLRPFEQVESMDDLIQLIASWPPLTGQVDENRAATQEMRREHPLQFLISRKVVHGDGLLTWTPQSPEDEEDMDLAQTEQVHFQLTSQLFLRGLLHALDSLEDLSDAPRHLQEMDNCDADSAQSIARSLHAVAEEDWPGAAACWPIAERLVRLALLRLDASAFNVQRGRSRSQYLGLASMLQALRTRGIDESWFRYLWTVLCSPAGFNLRNNLAHGVLVTPSPPASAALLHITIWLASLRFSDDSGAAE